jgi:hypothetical protein
LVLSAITSRAALSNAGAHDFVTEHAVADVDPAVARCHDPHDVVLDDGSFANPGLRVGRIGPPCRGEEKHRTIKNAVARIHFSTDRLLLPLIADRVRAMMQICNKRYSPIQLYGDGTNSL